MTSTIPEAVPGEDIPDAATLTQIVDDVFTGLLGTEAEAPYVSPHGTGILPVSATVSVSGGWTAQLIVACSDSFARRVAGDLLELAPAEVSDDDVRDVLGEVANVIGGNVKSIMPGPSALSLPEASLAGEPPCPMDVASMQLELAWHNEPMRITVWSPPDTWSPAPVRTATEENES